jgi:hypothetical protein
MKCLFGLNTIDLRKVINYQLISSKITKKQRIFAPLILTSILSLGTTITLLDAAVADSVEIPQNLATSKQSCLLLPRSVINAIHRDIRKNTRILSTNLPGQLRVIGYSSRNWPDRCLGLGKPGEYCYEIFIKDGWRVVMTDGKQTWIYRTDSSGETVREEKKQISTDIKLPNAVTNKVLDAASKKLGFPTFQLRITMAQKQTWANGCLGLAGPGQICTQALVPGWLVTVESNQQRLVYRTNESGSLVKLDEKASNILKE